MNPLLPRGKKSISPPNAELKNSTYLLPGLKYFFIVLILFSTTITYGQISNNFIDYTNGTHGTVCITPDESNPGPAPYGVITAPAGTVFTTVGFASYGTPNGSCNAFSVGGCDAPNSQSIVEGFLLGNGGSISISPSNLVFTDPCVGTLKRLYVQATYTQPICTGTSPGTITGTNPTGSLGYSYSWEKSTTGPSSGFTATGVTTKDYAPGNLTQTTWFRRKVSAFLLSDNYSKALQITVTNLPSATISYGGSPFCKSLGTAQSVTQSGTSGGTYSALSGLTINASTGAITPSTSTAGTYTVTYTMAAAGGCSVQTATTSVTITALPSSTISYAGSPFCKSVTTAQSVTLTGTSGGTYTASPSGLIINSSTGAIIPSTSTAGTYTVTYTVTASGGCAVYNATASISINPIPAAPVVTTPINYCLNAVASQLTATGSNLVWGSGPISGIAGGSAVLTTSTFVSNSFSNKKTDFTTTAANVNITTVDYYIPAYQAISGLQLALYNSSGTVIATSSTITTLNNNASTAAIISNIFNYTIAVAGNYSIGVKAGTGTIGGDSPAFPITEPTGTLNVTGTENLGTAPFHCFNNIQFTVNNPSTAPTPSTVTTGTTNYMVSQTVDGCVSPQATIAVIVNAPPSAIISYSGSPFCKSVTTAQSVTLTGTSGGAYSALSGLTINASTGAITPGTSTAGTYTVTYTMAAAGGCASQTATIPVTITALPSATISYAGSPFCKSVTTAQSVTQTGTSGGTYTASPSGLTINSSTGAITPSTSTAGSYTVTYTMAAAGGCAAQTATTSVLITNSPSATISYSSSPFCINSGSASVTQTGASGGTYSSTSGLSVNSSTGAINLNASTAGSYTITYTIAASGGCAVYTTPASITINPSVGIPVFSLGSTSTRCQGAGSITYTATSANSTGITYSLDAVSISGGNSINSSTGQVTYSAVWNGTSTINASAAGCGGPVTATHTVTTGTIPSVSGTSTFTCVGGASGTITATGTGGQSPYMYSLNSGTYQTSNLFTGLAAGTYALSVQSSTGCSSVATISVIVSPYPNSTDDQTIAGNNSWIGHTYSGMNFQNYIGHFTEAETFDEGFGGDYNCFTVSSGATYSSIYTEQFSVRFRMNSTRKGLYVADLGSDDGSRLTVDGTLLYNNWVDQSFSTRPSVLMDLTGTSSLVYDFYENGINNRVIFQNLTLVLANSLTTNTTQTICQGSTGSAISGDVFGSLPSGISLSGTGYQWSYSTTPAGTRTAIAGATSATYAPNTSSAPFNAPGTYYIYRNAKLNSSNNTGVSPYVATSESNAATIIVNAVSVGGSVGTNVTVCSGANSGTVTLSGNTGNVLRWESSTDGGATWSVIANTTTSQPYTNLTQTTLGRAVVQNGICASANSTPVTITVNPVSAGGTVNTSATVCSGANSGTLNLTGNTGNIIRWEYSINSGTSWTTISNTTTSQTYTNITQTTQYRAVVQSGACVSANSSAATITVNAVSVGGSVNTNATVCSGTNNGTLNLTGNTGNVIRWEYSINGGTSWTTISNTTTSQTYTNITQTTQYRAVVQSGACVSANSSAATITVNAVSVGGSVNTNATVCSGTNNGTLNLTGNTGNVIRWEYSINGGTSWTTISNTTTSQTYTNITQTTQYRAVVQSGACVSANSSAATITVNAVSVGGSVNTNATVCSGANNGTLNLTGNTGNVIRWEYSINGGTSWTTISNTTTSQTYTNITQTTQYRAVVQSGACVSANSSASAITVNPAPSATISYPGTPFCSNSGTASILFTGTTGGTYSSSAGLSINTTTGLININASVPGNYIVTYTISAGVCAAYSTVANVSITLPGTWTGTVSADWNDTRNWLCGQIPTSAIDVNIPGGLSSYPIVTSGIGYAEDVTIKNGGSLIIAGGTLQIFGAITNSGNFDVSAGTLEMKGSFAQTIAGSMFTNKAIKNLIVSNTGSGLSVSAAVNDTLKITGTLSFGNSSSTLNTGDNITLVSNNAGTANVGILGAGNSINGKATVERYINTGTGAGQHPAAWEFLSTPTTGQTAKESWMENGNIITGYGTVITAPTGTGFDRTSPSPSMKYYDYVVNNWVAVSNTNNPIVDQRGYMVFVRGDRTVNGTTVTTPVPTTLRTKGVLFTGTLPAMSLAPDKYASVGNPYASSIDFALLTKDATVDDAFYVWDPYLYGAYGVGGYQTLSSVDGWKPVPGGTISYPTGIPSGKIQSGQAFFVHATSNPSIINPNYTLTFSENCKTVGGGTVNRARGNGAIITSDRQFFRVSLFTGASSNSLIADGNVVAFDKGFSNGIDGNDALKLLNGGENFGLKRAGKVLAVEARNLIANTDTLYYNMSNLRQQTYQLRFAPENLEATGLEAYLIDSYLNTSIPVSLTDSSFVNIAVTSNAASSAADRFKVVFKTMSVLPVTFTSITAAQKNADILVEWKVENESGMQQYEVEKSLDGNTFSKTTTVAANNRGAANYSWLDANVTAGYNYYRIRSIGKDGQVNYTKIVKVWIGQMKAAIAVYPNPIVNGAINLQLINQPAGVYGIRLLNWLGQIMVSKQINHSEGSSTESIQYPHKLPKGIYQLEVTKPDGNVEVAKVVN